MSRQVQGQGQLATVPVTHGGAQGALMQYDETKYNVLVPTQEIQQVSPWHAERRSKVRVDPDPNKGDVYKVGSRKKPGTKNQYEDLYAMSKPALMRIAAAAGIIWNWRDSGVVTASSDHIIYKAVGAIRLPDGSWQPVMATKEIDLNVVEAEIRDSETKKVQEGIWGDEARRYRGQWQQLQGDDGESKGKRYFLAEDEIPRCVDARVRSQLIQWRKNKLMRAETGAMLRVIRAALGMRSQYTREELEKPFVVPRIDFSPDYSDPDVRQAVIEHGVKGMQSLFGAASGPSSATAFLPPGAGQGDQVRGPLMIEGDSGEEPGDDTPPFAPPADPGPGTGGDDDLSWMANEDEGGEDAGNSSLCTDCKGTIEDATFTRKGQQILITAPELAEQTKANFGRQLCGECAKKAAAAKAGGGRS